MSVQSENSRVAQGTHDSHTVFIAALASRLERSQHPSSPAKRGRIAAVWGTHARAGRPVIHASARESRQPKKQSPEGSNSREPRDCPEAV